MKVLVSKKHIFALSQDPIDYQLTVHFNNYEEMYGVGSFAQAIDTSNAPHITNLIIHYGYTRILEFLDECVQVRRTA